MREERTAGTLTYTGTAVEIVALLREHADARDRNADFFSAAAMRQGADEIEAGVRSEYKLSAVYSVDDEDDTRVNFGGELVEARANP